MKTFNHLDFGDIETLEDVYNKNLISTEKFINEYYKLTGKLIFPIKIKDIPRLILSN